MDEDLVDDVVLGDANSSMRLEFTVSVGYVRRRARVTDRWERRFSTAGLLVVGGLIMLAIVLIVLPRIMAAFGSP